MPQISSILTVCSRAQGSWVRTNIEPLRVFVLIFSWLNFPLTKILALTRKKWRVWARKNSNSISKLNPVRACKFIFKSDEFLEKRVHIQFEFEYQKTTPNVSQNRFNCYKEPAWTRSNTFGRKRLRQLHKCATCRHKVRYI